MIHSLKTPNLIGTGQFTKGIVRRIQGIFCGKQLTKKSHKLIEKFIIGRAGLTRTIHEDGTVNLVIYDNGGSVIEEAIINPDGAL